MKAAYMRAMDAIHRACLVVCGVCLAVIAIIIPWGVFTRYVLNSAASWPEPLAVLLMIVLAFLSAVVCYREHLHIGGRHRPGPARRAGESSPSAGSSSCAWRRRTCSCCWWGLKLVETTWNQTIGEFPAVSVGMSYLPVPMAGLLTLLFVVERLWTGALFPPPLDDATGTIALE